jgi:hypothetical protein
MKQNRRARVYVAVVAWVLMNTVGMAANCNCCCKAINMYGWDPGGGGATNCFGLDGYGYRDGIVVDSGVCVEAMKQNGNSCLQWQFQGCEMMCTGRFPADFNDPTALQEASGDIPGNAIAVGTYPEGDCLIPDFENGDVEPSNKCG